MKHPLNVDEPRSKYVEYCRCENFKVGVVQVRQMLAILQPYEAKEEDDYPA